MKTIIITAPFPVLERLRREANFSRYFRVQEVPGPNSGVQHQRLRWESKQWPSAISPSSLETQYIIDMFWLKYKQIFGR